MNLWSRISPDIFVVIFMGIVVLFICNASGVLYSSRSGMKRVYAVLSGLRMRLFVCVHVYIYIL